MKRNILWLLAFGIASFVSMSFPEPAASADKKEVTDVAIAAVLRAGDAWDTRHARQVHQLGVDRADRLAVFLRNPELRTSALVAIHYWPDKKPLEPSTTNELLKLAEDVKFEERLIAYATYLTSIPRPQQLPEVQRILKFGTPVEVKAVLGYLRRLSNNEDRRAELEQPEVQAVMDQAFADVERLVPAKYNLELVTWVTHEPFNSHPDYRNRASQLLIKHLDRFTDGKTKADETFGDQVDFLIIHSKADHDLRKEGVIEFFLKQNDAIAQSALTATIVTLKARQQENNPLLKEILDGLPRRQVRFTKMVLDAHNKM